MTVFCTECGKQASAASRYCVGCGSVLNQVPGHPTGQHARPDLSAPAAVPNPPSQGQHLYQTSSTDIAMQQSRSTPRTLLLSVGALFLGITAGLALREVGVLDFALGEKIAVTEANEQEQSAYDSGYKSGETAGTKTGDEQGYARGLDEGYSQGLKDGDTTGYDRGYLTGLDVGFIDAKTGITPTHLGDLKLTASWETFIGGEFVSGICFYSDGSRLDEWRQIKWAFISSDGKINFISDTNDDYNCFTESYIVREVGSMSKFSRLAIYVTADGKSDRFGPSPIPKP